jgi:murein DD-endopeptidase
VPPGTIVARGGAGRVLRVSSEFNRGGLKVFVDHGAGSSRRRTTSGARSSREGDLVRRGQPIALSGASGIDMLLMFPWNAPHVHFNVWLNGEPVDPFAEPGEASLWRRAERSRARRRPGGRRWRAPTAWDAPPSTRRSRSCDVAPCATSCVRSSDSSFGAMAVLFQHELLPDTLRVARRAVRATFPARAALDCRSGRRTSSASLSR